MRLWSILIFTLLLTGCATEIRQSPYGRDYFEIRQHFSKKSEFEANAMAQKRCAMQNATPKLVNIENGCFGCFSSRGGEFNLYTYQCVSNQSIAEDRQAADARSCSSWGFNKGTDGYANCMMRLYEVRIAVDNAAATNREIRNMTEQQRRAAEQDQAYKLLNLNMQIQQQNRPQTITPFTCNRFGNTVNCQ
jgi:hypothetical protein